MYLVGNVSDDLGPAVGEGDPVGASGVVAVSLLLQTDTIFGSEVRKCERKKHK